MVKDIKNNKGKKRIEFDKLWLARNTFVPQARFGLVAPNTIVVGMPGTGKSRYIVSPTILQHAQMGTSMVVVDAKGALYRKYAEFLEELGYNIKVIDIANPGNVRKKAKGHTKYHVKYNPFTYVKSEYDILKLANLLIGQERKRNGNVDPFWDEAGILMMSAAIAYMMEMIKPKKRNLRTLMDILLLVGEKSEERNAQWITNGTHERSKFDDLFLQLKEDNPDSFALRQYEKFRTCPAKTYNTVIITTITKVGAFDTTQVAELIAEDECDLRSIGDEKTVVFICVSDTDRSLDTLTNILISQLLNELCDHADSDFVDQRLPNDVLMIFDDFATNCVIKDFDKNVAGFRSRGISTMLLIQCESQLESMYSESERKSLICNCSTYVYLGGNDVSTADNISMRTNIPTYDILSMKLGTCYIFRVGERAKQDTLLDLEEWERAVGYTDFLESKQLLK